MCVKFEQIPASKLILMTIFRSHKLSRLDVYVFAMKSNKFHFVSILGVKMNCVILIYYENRRNDCWRRRKVNENWFLLASFPIRSFSTSEKSRKSILMRNRNYVGSAGGDDVQPCLTLTLQGEMSHGSWMSNINITIISPKTIEISKQC